MTVLDRHGGDIPSVFNLLGRTEVDLTAALGWTLTRSPGLLRELLTVLGSTDEPREVQVSLEVADDLGRTDIELVGTSTKAVLEAKRGWLVPGEAQLTQYAGRFTGFSHPLLVSLSDSSEKWASTQLPPDIGGVPVVHVSWDFIRDRARHVKRSVQGAEHLWLTELERYMGATTSTRDSADQKVFCVVISQATFGDLTFRQYVEQERVYFHPYGGRNGWPKRPPNFLCFRWEGRVRQVNRVESFEVVEHVSQRWPAISVDQAGSGASIIYNLGPNIPIPQGITTKGVYSSARVWCFLDQLLTHPNLADAIRATGRLTRPTT